MLTNFSTKPHWFSVANGNLAVNVYLLRTKIWTAYFMLRKRAQNNGKGNEKWNQKNDQKSDPLHLVLKSSTAYE